MRNITPFFDVIIRKNEEILIVFPAYSRDPYQSPLFSFNKKDLGILYRDETQEIVFTKFDKDVIDTIADAEFIQFIEVNKEGVIINSYKSAVIIEDNLK